MVDLSWKDATYVRIDKEFRNGSYMLDSDLLEKEMKAKQLLEYPKLWNLMYFIKFNAAIVVPIALWLLIVKDGWIVSLGILVLYIFSAYLFSQRQYGGVLGKVSMNYYGNLNAYNNTMAEYDYLLKELKKAEKIGGRKGIDAYVQLKKEMDQKYGKGEHLLAPPRKFQK